MRIQGGTGQSLELMLDSEITRKQTEDRMREIKRIFNLIPLTINYCDPLLAHTFSIEEFDQPDVFCLDDIERVIFNPPATIVIFKDGRKTIAKTMEEDEFQPEMGFAMAMMKEIFGTRGEYKRWIQQWVKEE